MEGVMAFAGMTTVELGDLPLVRWHACLDLTGPFEDASERWAQADGGSPRATDDEGYFEKLEDNVYRETDPAKTYEEQWVRTSDGEHRFLGARRGTALLVVAGETFGFATQTTEDMTATFVAGLTSEWMIEISAANPNLEGSSLVLPGVLSEWTILPGSTLELDALKPNFQKVTSTSDE
jgi:sarcosine oxidase delta subunit